MLPSLPTIKVCGLTRPEDVETCQKNNIDYLGINVWPSSKRYLPFDAVRELIQSIPGAKRVAVDVCPDDEKIRQIAEAGFSQLQLHFPLETPEARISDWVRQARPLKIWLAPKLPPATPLPVSLLALADTFLVDGYQPQSFGGTGKTANWEAFQHYQTTHPDKTWILAGGLNPDNIARAIEQSGTHFIDLNSGIESAPGCKSKVKLESLLTRLTTRPQTTR